MRAQSAMRVALPDEAVIWHDVECAAYQVDLPLWRELAEGCAGAVLDLGSGTGRVALDLASRGEELIAVDFDPALVAALAERARERGLNVETQVADVRAMELGRELALAIAPMQVAQLLGGRNGRRAMLGTVRRHLRRGGVLAVALADPLEGLPVETALPPLPDVREAGGWVFSSTPTALRGGSHGVVIDRHRQAVSPKGELFESMASIQLDRVAPAGLAEDAGELGYRPLAPRSVPSTGDYVGSTVVMLEAT